jgi:hypothetical protein
MEVVLDFFSKAVSEVKKRYYLLIIAAFLNGFFILFWYIIPYIIDFKKPIYYIYSGIFFILVFNYFVVSNLLIIVSDYVDERDNKEPIETSEIKDKNKFINKVFSEYSDVDKRELVNLVLSIEEMNRILQDKSANVDIPLSNLSVLWREKSLEDKAKKKKKPLKRGQSIWTTVFGRAFLDNGEVVKNRLLKNFLSIFEKIVEDVYENLDGDLSESKINLDLFVVFILLKRLDRNDTCSSVVDKFTANDSDKNKKANNYFELECFRDASSLRTVNAYDILSNITLLEHSVNVSLWTIRYILENNYGYPITISAVLVALAHDIGKIPDIYEEELERYSTTDHPYASANYLKKLTTFSSIPDARMRLIEESILKHHGKLESKNDAQNIFHEILKKADHNAREMEIQAYQQSQGKFVNDELPFLKAAEFDFPLDDEELEYNDEQDDDEISILILVKNMQKELRLLMVERFSVKYKKPEPKQNSEEQSAYQPQWQTMEQTTKQEQEAEPKNEQLNTSKNIETTPAVANSLTNYNNDEVINNIQCVNDGFIENILKRIAQAINTTSSNKTAQMTYNAFSFKDTIFVTSFFVKQCIKDELKNTGCTDLAKIIDEEQKEYDRRAKEAKNAGIPLNQVKDDRIFTQKVLHYVIIEKIKKEYDLIDTNYIKDNFFGGYFDVYLDKGEKLSETNKKSFYVPFKMDVFRKIADLTEIESRKEREGKIFKRITEIKYGGNNNN